MKLSKIVLLGLSLSSLFHCNFTDPLPQGHEAQSQEEETPASLPQLAGDFSIITEFNLLRMLPNEERIRAMGLMTLISNDVTLYMATLIASQLAHMAISNPTSESVYRCVTSSYIEGTDTQVKELHECWVGTHAEKIYIEGIRNEIIETSYFGNGSAAQSSQSFMAELPEKVFTILENISVEHHWDVSKIENQLFQIESNLIDLRYKTVSAGYLSTQPYNPVFALDDATHLDSFYSSFNPLNMTLNIPKHSVWAPLATIVPELFDRGVLSREAAAANSCESNDGLYCNTTNTEEIFIGKFAPLRKNEIWKDGAGCGTEDIAPCYCLNNIEFCEVTSSPKDYVLQESPGLINCNAIANAITSNRGFMWINSPFQVIQGEDIESACHTAFKDLYSEIVSQLKTLDSIQLNEEVHLSGTATVSTGYSSSNLIDSITFGTWHTNFQTLEKENPTPTEDLELASFSGTRIPQ